jgi:hypothetical protein
MFWPFKKRIFISFDYDKDRRYRHLLTALSRNSKFDIDFFDHTPGEIKTNQVDRIKAVLSKKIADATHTLVIIGEDANKYHREWMRIGTINWQWWEIERSVELQKGLIAVKIARQYDVPDPLYGVGAKWAHSFNVDAIAKAIDES